MQQSPSADPPALEKGGYKASGGSGERTRGRGRPGLALSLRSRPLRLPQFWVSLPSPALPRDNPVLLEQRWDSAGPANARVWAPGSRPAADPAEKVCLLWATMPGPPCRHLSWAWPQDFFFFFLAGQAQGLCKFQGQGANPRHSGDIRPLGPRATRELLAFPFLRSFLGLVL